MLHLRPLHLPPFSRKSAFHAFPSPRRSLPFPRLAHAKSTSSLSSPTSLPTPTPPPPSGSISAAVGLIVGTAIGPGMLGLPAATLRSGPLPSSIAIILTWIYVVSSILLVAELSFSAMEEGSVQEVSFTALAANAFGEAFGSVVALVYSSLSFALVIACVSGIGSLVVQFLSIDPILANAVFPCLVGTVISSLPFTSIDTVNRALCMVMVVSITALVAVGVSVGRSNLLDSFRSASWSFSAILPAIPVAVLTFGFHVITPFMCRIVGDSVYDARKAVLVGGAIPLAMVLSWNLVVLGLLSSTAAASGDPIAVLLSVNPSALPAVQGFAFTALMTSLIGYAVSFPKQLMDTVELIWEMGSSRRLRRSVVDGVHGGQVGFITFHSKGNVGDVGQALFGGLRSEIFSEGSGELAGDWSSGDGFVKDPVGDTSKLSSRRNIVAMWAILFSAILVGTYMRTAFSKALDFAGIYANCFLFGILPPAMAWIHRSRRRNSSVSLLPGGNVALFLLFAIAMLLLFWH